MTLCNSPYFVQCCIYVLKKIKQIAFIHPTFYILQLQVFRAMNMIHMLKHSLTARTS